MARSKSSGQSNVTRGTYRDSSGRTGTITQSRGGQTTFTSSGGGTVRGGEVITISGSAGEKSYLAEGGGRVVAQISKTDATRLSSLQKSVSAQKAAEIPSTKMQTSSTPSTSPYLTRSKDLPFQTRLQQANAERAAQQTQAVRLTPLDVSARPDVNMSLTTGGTAYASPSGRIERTEQTTTLPGGQGFDYIRMVTNPMVPLARAQPDLSSAGTTITYAKPTWSTRLSDAFSVSTRLMSYSAGLPIFTGANPAETLEGVKTLPSDAMRLWRGEPVTENSKRKLAIKEVEEKTKALTDYETANEYKLKRVEELGNELDTQQFTPEVEAQKVAEFNALVPTVKGYNEKVEAVKATEKKYEDAGVIDFQTEGEARVAKSEAFAASKKRVTALLEQANEARNAGYETKAQKLEADAARVSVGLSEDRPGVFGWMREKAYSLSVSAEGMRKDAEARGVKMVGAKGASLASQAAGVGDVIDIREKEWSDAYDKMTGTGKVVAVAVTGGLEMIRPEGLPYIASSFIPGKVLGSSVSQVGSKTGTFGQRVAGGWGRLSTKGLSSYQSRMLMESQTGNIVDLGEAYITQFSDINRDIKEGHYALAGSRLAVGYFRAKAGDVMALKGFEHGTKYTMLSQTPRASLAKYKGLTNADGGVNLVRAHGVDVPTVVRLYEPTTAGTASTKAGTTRYQMAESAMETFDTNLVPKRSLNKAMLTAEGITPTAKQLKTYKFDADIDTADALKTIHVRPSNTKTEREGREAEIQAPAKESDIKASTERIVSGQRTDAYQKTARDERTPRDTSKDEAFVRALREERAERAEKEERPERHRATREPEKPKVERPEKPKPREPEKPKVERPEKPKVERPEREERAERFKNDIASLPMPALFAPGIGAGGGGLGGGGFGRRGAIGGASNKIWDIPKSEFAAMAARTGSLFAKKAPVRTTPKKSPIKEYRMAQRVSTMKLALHKTPRGMTPITTRASVSSGLFTPSSGIKVRKGYKRPAVRRVGKAVKSKALSKNLKPSRMKRAVL